MFKPLIILLISLSCANIASTTLVITGAHTNVNRQTRERPSRLEINTLAQTGPQWDLFILSVLKIQNRTQDDPTSWFGIAGIHGRPFQAWDGVLGVNGNMGYAPHQSILFGPWHRVFLAAYEQVISEAALAIAAEYPGQQKQNYMFAAQNLRIPYWDWASRAELPAVLTDPQLTVNTPIGYQTFTNPLASYVFKPRPGENQFPLADGVSKYAQTVRSPDNDGNSQVSAINSLLKSNANSILDKLYLLIARQKDYQLFSNTGVPANVRQGAFDSLESIHNMVHAFVGGMGHMGYIPYSAFDPIFFMHHTNIDRCLAIWSAINPGSYVVPQVNLWGTYTEQAGTTEDINTVLTPFHKNDAGSFHTAADARDTFNYGYTYPEITDWNVDASQLASNTRKSFNDLYNPQGLLSKRAASRKIRLPSSRIMPKNELNQTVGTTSPREWYINLSVKKDAKKAFFVNFFFGSPAADASTWATAKNLIIAQPVLSDMMGMTMDPTADSLPALSQIPLTRNLVNALRDPSDVNGTAKFIKDNLQWRLAGLDGSVLGEAEIADKEVKISVVDQEVELTPSQADFHIYGPFNEHAGLKWG